jgi:single-strand DNA-binding protein
MAGETIITVVGNLVDDPELRFTPSGAAVANFRIASTPRTFDRQANEWKDGEALFLSCSVWRQAAENVAESLTRGMRVVVQGRLKARSYETREGEKRTVFEIEVEEVGPSLKYATAKVTRATRSGGGGGYGSSGGDDPWAAPAQGSSAPAAQGSSSGSSQGSSSGGSWGGQQGGGQWGGQQGGGQGSSQGGGGASQPDPWATPAGSDEPPF